MKNYLFVLYRVYGKIFQEFIYIYIYKRKCYIYI
jgi:hypothetical protein